MKKRLLTVCSALMAAASGFAISSGEIANTTTGAFLVTSDDNYYAGSFAGAAPEGWTVETETGVTIEDLFVTGSDENYQYAQPTAACAAKTEGMSYTFSTDGTYVLAFKMRNSAETAPAIPLTTRQASVSTTGTNFVSVMCNNVEVFKPTMINADWTEYCVALDNVEEAKIVLKDMNADVQIADVQIKKAVPVYDMSQAQYWVDYAKVICELSNWKDSEPECISNLMAYVELIESPDFDVKNIDDCQSIIEGVKDEILKAETTVLSSMLGSDAKNRIEEAPIGAGRNYQKQEWWGIWHDTAKRLKQRSADDNSIPMPWNTPALNKAALTNAGVEADIEFEPGKYVFSIDGRFNGCFESYTWYDGLNNYAGKISVTPVVEDGTLGDAIAVKDGFAWDWRDFERKMLPFQITKSGKYRVRVEGDAIYSTGLGGSFYIRNASLYGMLAGEYTQAELDYVKAVQTQVQTAVDQRTLANDNLLDETKFWGKVALQDTLNSDEIKVRFEEYEKLLDPENIDVILATFDPEIFDPSDVKKPEALLAYEVYDNLTKHLIDANRQFAAKNDTLSMIPAAVAKTTQLLSHRIYAEVATGGPVLVAKVAEANALYDALKADDYSTENADTIVKVCNEISEAVAECQNTIPAEKVSTVMEFDFNFDKTDFGPEEGTAAVEVPASVGNVVMNIDNYTNITSTVTNIRNLDWEFGVDAGGIKSCPDVLRVGNNGVASVANIDLGETGSNIYRISMDWWFLRLTNGYVGFRVKNDAGEDLTGLYFNPYQQATDNLYDPCGIQNGQQFFVANTTGDAASCADNNHTYMELIIDFGEKTQFIATRTTGKNYFESNIVPFTAETFSGIEISSSYTYFPGRRCWMDNLRIEKIEAGPTSVKGVVDAAKAAVKTVKKFINGQVVIETPNGTFNAVGVQVK